MAPSEGGEGHNFIGLGDPKGFNPALCMWDDVCVKDHLLLT